MCRIGVYQNIDNETILGWALLELQFSQGGHGNGFWSQKTDKVEKGLDLGVDKIATKTANMPGIHIFHTRLCSSGSICNESCHPFQVGDWTLVHNGTWSGWRAYSEDEKSDTECAASLLAEYGPGVLLSGVFSGSGVWVFSDGKEGGVYVVRRSGKFYTHQVDKDSFFHASEPLAALSGYNEPPTDWEEVPQYKMLEIKDDGETYEWEIDPIIPDVKKRGYVSSGRYNQKTGEVLYGYGNYGYGGYEGWDSGYEDKLEVGKAKRGNGRTAGRSITINGEPLLFPDRDSCYCTKSYDCSFCREEKAAEQEAMLVEAIGKDGCEDFLAIEPDGICAGCYNTCDKGLYFCDEDCLKLYLYYELGADTLTEEELGETPSLEAQVMDIEDKRAERKKREEAQRESDLAQLEIDNLTLPSLPSGKGELSPQMAAIREIIPGAVKEIQSMTEDEWKEFMAEE